MPPIFDQEAALELFADLGGQNKDDLGSEDIRFFLSMYHNAYLPIAALVEYRLNEVDRRETYKMFNFSADLATFSEQTLEVTVDVAPQSRPYLLRAPFTVDRSGLRLVATQDLLIDIGTKSATTVLRSTLIGAAGTPRPGIAEITSSVGWLRNASVTVRDVVPGSDGLDDDALRRKFQAVVFNPTSLVKGREHADHLLDNHEEVGRAIAIERAKVIFDNGNYFATIPAPDHLTLAVIKPDGSLLDATSRRKLRKSLLPYTIRYGEQYIHVVPMERVQIGGEIEVIGQQGAPIETIKTDIYNRLDAYLNWRTWKPGQKVTHGGIFAVAQQAIGVEGVVDVRLRGKLSDGSESQFFYHLEPWEVPINGIFKPNITVTT